MSISESSHEPLSVTILTGNHFSDFLHCILILPAIKLYINGITYIKLLFGGLGFFHSAVYEPYCYM